MTITDTIHRALVREHESGKSIRGIASEIPGISQPELRAFALGISAGSTGLLDRLAKRYGLELSERRKR